MTGTAAVWEAAGVPAIVIMGVVLHFAFGWSGRNLMVGLVAPVNESAWEHLKMGFWPTTAYAALQFVATDVVPPHFWMAHAAGVYTIATLMLALYLIAEALPWQFGMAARLTIDGLTFVVAVVAGQCVTLALTRHPVDVVGGSTVGIAAFAFAAAILAATTVKPPRWSLFRDQQDGTFGIRRQQ